MIYWIMGIFFAFCFIVWAGLLYLAYKTEIRNQQNYSRYLEMCLKYEEAKRSRKKEEVDVVNLILELFSKARSEAADIDEFLI